ncbi:hypothetical protein [Nocardia wallacei]|uniref:hypothetical protein n=1 Tax=Nocardia wallacei TaxID=480035 RepID=UPI00245870C6|nr:hypothetical protein [Nocardia wallacei]
MPTISAIAAGGTCPTTVTVLARPMKAPPAIPAVPLLLSIITPTMTAYCCHALSRLNVLLLAPPMRAGTAAHL